MARTPAGVRRPRARIPPAARPRFPPRGDDLRPVSRLGFTCKLRRPWEVTPLNDSALTRFFGVVVRPQTWLGIVFHVLAFPLGLFYFVFLVTGLSVGVSLVVDLGGHPDPARRGRRLVVVRCLRARAGAVPARARRPAGAAGVGAGGRRVGQARAPTSAAGRPGWTSCTCSPSCVLGTISFSLLVIAASTVGWFLAMPYFAIARRADRQRHVGAAAVVRHPARAARDPHVLRLPARAERLELDLRAVGRGHVPRRERAGGRGAARASGGRRACAAAVAGPGRRLRAGAAAPPAGRPGAAQPAQSGDGFPEEETSRP